MTTKRTDYIEWDRYFMDMAILASKRSKDPHTQVGACIVNEKNRVVATGYNGFPNGIDDDDERFSWARRSEHPDEPLRTKTFFVCHAELNAILNKNVLDIEGCKIYSTLFPCASCALAIIQSGITEVIYLEDKRDKDEYKAARMLFDFNKRPIKHRQYVESKTDCI
jgi:dCMP deaminase